MTDEEKVEEMKRILWDFIDAMDSEVPKGEYVDLNDAYAEAEMFLRGKL